MRGSGFGSSGLGFGGSGCRGSGFRGLGFRGSGFKVKGLQRLHKAQQQLLTQALPFGKLSRVPCLTQPQGAISSLQDPLGFKGLRV